MDVQGQMQELASGQPVYVTRPAGNAALPAVIVVQEAFGLNANIKRIADRVAAEGYVVIAPDMFWRGGKGQVATYDELPKALGFMGALNDADIVGDIDDCVRFLQQQAGVRGDRIGITGFCMGGRVSYLAACELGNKLAASAPFYGGGIPIYLTEKLACPVLAFFGDADPYIPMDQVEALRAEAAQHGKSVEIVVYPGAPHGFFCDERDSYRPEAAAQAWEKLKAFFGAQLKS